jgi:hypothetical protein
MSLVSRLETTRYPCDRLGARGRIGAIWTLGATCASSRFRDDGRPDERRHDGSSCDLADAGDDLTVGARVDLALPLITSWYLYRGQWSASQPGQGISTAIFTSGLLHPSSRGLRMRNA